MPNDSWTLNYANSLVSGFSLSSRTGSCLGVFVDSYKPVANLAKDAQKYGKDLGAIAQSLPALGQQLEQSARAAIPWLASKGADRVNAAMMAGAIGIATAVLGRAGAAGARLAANPAVLGVVIDAGLAYGVGREGIAAYQGTCHP